MSFDQRERSNHDGQPFVLYEFSLAQTVNGEKVYGRQAWRYTSQESDLTYNGNVYTAVPIEDDGVSLTSEIQNDEFLVTMPVWLPIPQLYRASPPSEPIYLTVRRKHWDDEEAPVYWVGTVYAVNQPDDIRAVLKCRMLTASFDRNGLRLVWCRNCPHALYDESCRVSKDTYRDALVITSKDGVILRGNQLGARPGNYYAGGFIEWELYPGVWERRAIESHSGYAINILGSTDGLSVGQTVSIYPGCDRTTGGGGCAKFNNLSNYGGFVSMPGKSPFDSNPIFY